MKLGKPIKYIAIPPSEVVERVKKNMRIEADEKVKRLEEMKGTETDAFGNRWTGSHADKHACRHQKQDSR